MGVPQQCLGAPGRESGRRSPTEVVSYSVYSHTVFCDTKFVVGICECVARIL